MKRLVILTWFAVMADSISLDALTELDTEYSIETATSASSGP